MRPREYPVANRAGAAIDYSRLAAAVGEGSSGRAVNFHQTVHNPVRESDIKAVQRKVDFLGTGWDPH